MDTIAQITKCVECGEHPGSNIYTIGDVRGYCGSCKDAADGWVEDAALGVAVREVRAAIEVRALSVAGDHAIQRAARSAYGASSRHLYPVDGVWHIGVLHRLAFARALSPIAEPTVHEIPIGGGA